MNFRNGVAEWVCVLCIQIKLQESQFIINVFPFVPIWHRTIKAYLKFIKERINNQLYKNLIYCVVLLKYTDVRFFQKGICHRLSEPRLIIFWSALLAFLIKTSLGYSYVCNTSISRYFSATVKHVCQTTEDITRSCDIYIAILITEW